MRQFSQITYHSPFSVCFDAAVRDGKLKTGSLSTASLQIKMREARL